MIKAREGLKAVFRVKDETKNHKARTQVIGNNEVKLDAGECLEELYVVEAWDDDGSPLVIEDGQLVPAAKWKNFVGVRDHVDLEDDRVVRIAACTDHVIWRVDEDGKTFSSAVIAWALVADGSIYPVESDSHGWTEITKPGSDFLVLHRGDGTPPQEWVEERIVAMKRERGQ